MTAILSFVSHVGSAAAALYADDWDSSKKRRTDKIHALAGGRFFCAVFGLDLVASILANVKMREGFDPLLASVSDLAKTVAATMPAASRYLLAGYERSHAEGRIAPDLWEELRTLDSSASILDSRDHKLWCMRFDRPFAEDATHVAQLSMLTSEVLHVHGIARKVLGAELSLDGDTLRKPETLTSHIEAARAKLAGHVGGLGSHVSILSGQVTARMLYLSPSEDWEDELKHSVEASEPARAAESSAGGGVVAQQSKE
jgi:hypothetical protein